MIVEQMIQQEDMLPTIIFLQQISKKRKIHFLVEKNAKTIDCLRAAFVSTGSLFLRLFKAQFQHRQTKRRKRPAHAYTKRTHC